MNNLTAERKNGRSHATHHEDRKKGADWKVSIAKRLRKETTAKNPWIAQRLQFGHPTTSVIWSTKHKSIYFAFAPF
ncbi:MAG: hypothetical protein ACSHX4_03855 [Opitutaceae bacterium]